MLRKQLNKKNLSCSMRSTVSALDWFLALLVELSGSSLGGVSILVGEFGGDIWCGLSDCSFVVSYSVRRRDKGR